MWILMWLKLMCVALLDYQADEKSVNATSEIRTFKSDLETLQNQLNDIVLRANRNKNLLDELQITGGDMQDQHVSLRSFLEGNAASLRGLNQTLTSYSGLINNLQTDTARLQSDIQGQVKVLSQTQLSVNSLNISQSQQRYLLTTLQKTVEETSRAVQSLKNDYQTLQQTARQARADTEWLKEKVHNLQVLAANNSALARSNGEALDDLGAQLSTLASQIQNTSAVTEGHDQRLREMMDHQRDHDNITSSRFDEMEMRLDRHESNMDLLTGNISFSAQLLGAISSDVQGLRSCAETVIRHSDLLLGLNSSVTEASAESKDLRTQQDELAARLDREVNNLSMVMEEMKLVDSKHSQLITNFTILQGNEHNCSMCKILFTKNINVQEIRFFSVIVIFQVHQVQGAPKETGDPRDQWASWDKRVIKERKGFQEHLDLRERKVLLVYLVRQVHRVHLGLGVFQDLKAREGLEVDLEALVTKVTLGQQDFLV